MIESKKILFISHWYPNIENPFFGIFIKNHAEAISLKNDVTVINFDVKFSKKTLSINLLNNSNQSFTIKIESRFYKLFYYLLPLHYFLFNRIIKKFKINIKSFDLLFSNVIFPNGILGYKISKRYNIKQIHIEHWSKLHKFFKKDLYRIEGKKALTHCSKIICVSNFLKQELENYTNTDIVVIPNIVNQNKFTPTNKIIKKDVIHFLALANWQKPKNPFYFLDALEKYKDCNSKFDLTIIGSGPLLNDVKSKKYSFDIFFKGILSSDEIAHELNKSNFVLHGSDYETFSVVIIEALSSGTPILVSDIGIAKEVINSENGFICENNSEDWFNKIKLAVNKKYDSYLISNSIQNKYDLISVSNQFQSIIRLN